MQTKQLLFGLVCYSITSSLFAESPTANKKPTYTVSANPTLNNQNQEPKEKKPEEDCDIETPSSFRFSTVHREAKGIGYNEGYTSFNGFLAFTSIKNWHPFFDIRTHFFNDWNVAANAGFGLRYQPNSLKTIFGVNGFFDYRHTKHSVFEQAGAGFEVLGTKWESRINGYFPIIKKTNLYEVAFTNFSVNSALFAVNQDLAFSGYDISLGRTLIQKQYYTLSSTLGGYMFFADFNKSAKGGLLKLKTTISRYFSVEVQTSYDSLFKGILQGQGALNIPFGKKIKARKKGLSCNDQFALAQRLAEPVDRFEIIVTDSYNIQTIAKNPHTGNDLHIVFVDNTNSGGDGTAENPYGTLLDAELSSKKDQMIYVYGGTSTTTGMDVGITLKDRQWLQGSSRPFITLTPYGFDTVPAQTKNWPTIGNTLGNTVTLANGNIITGINIIASPIASTNAIYGFNITDFTASYNTCAGAPLYDFSLANPSGIISISHNNSYSKNGIYLSTTKDVTLNIQNNLFSNKDAQNMNLQFKGNSKSLASIRNNTLQLCLDGSTISTESNSNLTVNFDGNTILKTDDSANYGIQFKAADLSTMIGVLVNNTSQVPSLKGFDFLTTDSALSFFYVEDNTGTYSGNQITSYPFNFTVDSSATTNLLLEGNSANSTGYRLTNNSGLATFNIQSPTLSLEGVESLNTGTFLTDGSGQITFISYTPSSTPGID